MAKQKRDATMADIREAIIDAKGASRIGGDYKWAQYSVPDGAAMEKALAKRFSETSLRAVFKELRETKALEKPKYENGRFRFMFHVGKLDALIAKESAAKGAETTAGGGAPPNRGGASNESSVGGGRSSGS